MVSEEDIELLKQRVINALHELESGSVQDICSIVGETERGNVKLALYRLNQDKRVFLKENRLNYREDGGAIIESYYSLF